MCSANHAHITCSTLICAVINQLLTLVSLVTKCGLGGIAGTTSAVGSTRTSSSRQVRLLLPPTPPPVLHPAPFHPRLLAPLLFSCQRSKDYIFVFKKNEDYKNLLRVLGKKKEVAETFACFREREKKDLIREVESCRTPIPFSFCDGACLFGRSDRLGVLTLAPCWYGWHVRISKFRRRALSAREDFVRSRSALNPLCLKGRPAFLSLSGLEA